jgi:anti-anti-sigma factor
MPVEIPTRKGRPLQVREYAFKGVGGLVEMHKSFAPARMTQGVPSAALRRTWQWLGRLQREFAIRQPYRRVALRSILDNGSLCLVAWLLGANEWRERRRKCFGGPADPRGEGLPPGSWRGQPQPRGKFVRLVVRFSHDVAIVALKGKFLAGGDGPYLRQKLKDLIDAGTKRLMLDFSDVPYIDSTGLGFLAGARVTAENAGARMVLASLNPHVKKILDEVKLAQFFVIAPDEESALAKLREATVPAEGPKPAPAREPKGKKHSPASSEP